MANIVLFVSFVILSSKMRFHFGVLLQAGAVWCGQPENGGDQPSAHRVRVTPRACRHVRCAKSRKAVKAASHTGV
jgi:hypothetical protein